MLHNLDIHKDCFCYEEGKNFIAEYFEFAHKKTNIVDIWDQEIIFVIKGSFEICLKYNEYDRKLVKDEFIFMPAGTKLLYKSPAGSAILVIRLSEKILECNILRFNEPFVMPNKHNGIYALKLNDHMKHFVTGLIGTMKDGIKCKTYMKGEASKMLFLIRYCYPQDEYIKFFSSITSPDLKFSEFVRLNFMKYKTIEKMAYDINMTKSRFSRQFKKLFGMTPRSWVQREKAQLIYNEICQSDKLLKDIADKYEYTAVSNFTRYCNMKFGASPNTIRKRLKLKNSA